MSKTIDERVVQMRFDNKQFESNVRTSMNTLDKLKQSLKLKDATKGFEEVNSAAKRIDISPLSQGVEAVKMKFSALEVMAVTALANITNSALNAGKRIVSAFTVEPIEAGFQEYETQINAVQTILANTSHKGTTLDQVNAALDELNTYADKTIYNFTEMTRNIGTFTAAGLDLNTSVKSIQGISNVAAISGSTSQQASTAMYQLSQALSAGTVQLMDWNSVVNAGMGGKVFQDAIIQTGKEMGILNKGMIEAYENGASFRSLLDGQGGYGKWFTSDLLSTTLGKFTKTGVVEYMADFAGVSKESMQALQDLGDKANYNSDEFNNMALSIANGDTELAENIKSTLKMASTAEDAATKVKTFTQLMDTLKEAAQSGWTQSWEILIGDFEEAKTLWTGVSDYLSEVINKSSEARNKVLQGWADKGGREMAIESIKNAFNGLLSIINPIKEAFREVFPPMTAKNLLDISKSIKELTSNFKISNENTQRLKETFKGLFSVLDILKKVLVGVGKGIGGLLGSDGAGSFIDMILKATSAVGRFLTSLNEGFDANGFNGIMITIGSGIGNFVKMVSDKLQNFSKLFPSIGEGIAKSAKFIWDGVKTVFSTISQNVSIGDIFAGLAGGGIFAAAMKFASAIKAVKDAILGLFDKKTEGIKSKFVDIMDSIHDSLQSFATGLKVASIVGIAVAVGILASSMRKISELDVGQIGKSLFSIGALVTMLSLSLKSMTKTLKKYDSKGLIKAGTSLVLMAAAIKILAGAMEKIGKLSLKELAKGLIGVGAGLGFLVAGIKIIDGVKIKLSTSVAIIAMAKACEMLGDAMQKFSGLSWEEIARGLAAMGGALGELVGAMAILKKVGGFKSLLGSVSILILVQSLSDLAEALAKFGKMQWDEIGRGLAAMGGALGELVGAMAILKKVGGFKSIFGAGGILIVIQGLDDLAEALKKFGKMKWDEIGRGLTAMGGALGEVSAACTVVGKIAGFKSIIGAGLILIVIQGLDELANALQKFGSMTWSEIGRGLTAMGGALLEVSLFSGALGMIAGFSGIIGAGSILIVIQGLDDLANALIKFGSMTWSEIARGLTAMGGALLEVSLFSGALGMIAGIGAIFGAGAILLTIQGLDDLANALIKFGSMSWEEIGRGLVAMGGALLEVSLFSGVLGTIAGIGAIIGGGAILLTIQGLDDLANALIKFGSMSWEEIGRGLTAMGGALLEVSLFSGALGAIAGIGAIFGGGAIYLATQGLDDLAEALIKFGSMSWEEVKSGLTAMGAALGEIAVGSLVNTLSLLGSLSISKVAEPLGVLADSVKKWNSVSVPEGLADQLDSLSSGIKSFSWAFMGGWSMDAVDGPLGNLADSVKKWNGVTVPEGLGEQLSGLSDGVKAFSWAFMGGWSMDAVNGPLGAFADSVKKWYGVSIPDGLKSQLSELADGVKAFSWAFMGSWSIGSLIEPLGDLATAVKKWNGVSVSDDLSTRLKSFAEAVVTFANDVNELTTIDSESISSFANSISTVNRAVQGIVAVDASRVNAFVNAVKRLDGIKIDTSGLSTSSLAVTGVIKSMMKSVNDVIATSKTSINVSMRTSIMGAVQAIKSCEGQIIGATNAMLNRFISTIQSKKSQTTLAFTSLVSEASKGIQNNYDSFVSAGIHLATGLIKGISLRTKEVYDAGYALGQTAVKGEKDGQKSHSPSKLTIQAGKWLGEGLVIGMNKMSNSVYSSGKSMGAKAVSSISGALNTVSDSITRSSDATISPKIRPVVDLSNVSATRFNLNAGMDITVSRPVNALSQIISNAQKEANSINREVATAINGLREDIDNLYEMVDSKDFNTYLDSKKVSQALAKPMTRELNNLAKRGR